MKSDCQTAVPLTPEDVQKILSICSPRGLLVGGQALAFWADHLQVERPVNLVSGVTADADFTGDSVLAQDLARRLGWRRQVKQVDFLSVVVESERKDLIRRAIDMEVPEIGRLRVVHPVDVLTARETDRCRHRTGAARRGFGAIRVFLLYGVDPLKAVPLEDFRTTSTLHKVRWPHIVAEVGEKRESLRKLSSR